MRYKLFGRSGLRVSELCLGTMTFCNDWAPIAGADAATSQAIFEAFVEAGGNFIDTSHLYSYESTSGEELVGEFIRSDRDHFVVSTKYALSMGDDLIKSGNSRKNMIRCAEESLRRLKTDYIDVYWLHIWDSSTPIDEIMRGFDDLVSSGKVHYIAISDTPAWHISRAVMLSELRGWSRFSGIQVEYNLLERTAERELLPMARELGLSVCAWSPLARGKLSGKCNHGSPGADSANAHCMETRAESVVQLVVKLSAELGCTPSQLALNAIRRIGESSAIIPILGARTVAQIEDNLGCLKITLEDDHLRQLEQASSIDLGFPHGILNALRPYAYGGKLDLLDWTS